MLGRLLVAGAFALLVVYSACMLHLDLSYGEEVARGYFSDIVASGRTYDLALPSLYGINTSLSVIVLSCIALLYIVCIGFHGRRVQTKRDRMFQIAQAGFFSYFAADDRLMLHETVGVKLGMEDAYLLLVLGLLQLLALFLLAHVHRQIWPLKASVLAAGGLFFLMVLVDAFVPREMHGRLALEDLFKLWATVFLLLYAWLYCQRWIGNAPIFAGQGEKHP